VSLYHENNWIESDPNTSQASRSPFKTQSSNSSSIFLFASVKSAQMRSTDALLTQSPTKTSFLRQAERSRRGRRPVAGRGAHGSGGSADRPPADARRKSRLRQFCSGQKSAKSCSPEVTIKSVLFRAKKCWVMRTGNHGQDSFVPGKKCWVMFTGSHDQDSFVPGKKSAESRRPIDLYLATRDSYQENEPRKDPVL
jgi:hypothetical protein